jgi:hypothetical protein
MLLHVQFRRLAKAGYLTIDIVHSILVLLHEYHVCFLHFVYCQEAITWSLTNISICKSFSIPHLFPRLLSKNAHIPSHIYYTVVSFCVLVIENITVCNLHVTTIETQFWKPSLNTRNLSGIICLCIIILYRTQFFLRTFC